jgi:hypothetical protein
VKCGTQRGPWEVAVFKFTRTILCPYDNLYLYPSSSKHPKLLPRHLSMPSQAVKPLETPVKLNFPDKTELTSVIDPVTLLHSVQCDLCGKLNQLGPRGAGNSIYQHRGSEGCRKCAIKQEKQAAKARLQVSSQLSDD